MTKTHEIKAQSRKDEGKGASRRLRRTGFVPAVVYGGGADHAPQSIQIEHNTILLAAKHEWFFSSLLDLNVDGKVQKVLVRDWQKHPFKQLMMHMDFLRVNENEAIRVSVPLHFLNQEKSPAGKTSGVVISHNLTEVEISCLPKDLPEFIEVDLSGLSINESIHLSQLKVPDGVQLLDLLKEDAAVVAIHSPRAEEPEPVAAEAAATETAAAPATAAGAAGAAAPATGDAAKKAEPAKKEEAKKEPAKKEPAKKDAKK